MSRAAANEITVRGLNDIIQMAEVATVVWEQGGDLSDQELLIRSLATVRVLLDSEWAEIGDMVVSEWALENQKLALVDPHEAMERLFARSRELIAEEGGAGEGPIRKWSLTTDEAVARIKEEWIALGSRTPSIADIGWLLNTAKGDERGRLMLTLQSRVIDFALKGGHGSVVTLNELAAFLEILAPDFSAEELREGTMFALFGLLARDLAQAGTLRKILGRTWFARWKPIDVEEAVGGARRTCAGLPGGPEQGDVCAVRVLRGAASMD